MTTASPSSSKLKKDRPEFVESMLDTLKQNGGLLTVFAVALIFVSGITIIDSPSNWWVAALAVAVFFVTIFLFMNARVFLKVIAAAVVTLMLSSFAFKIGSFADPQGTGGLVWMCATLFLFFGCMAFSYMVSSGKSRWGTLMAVQILAFLATYSFSIGFVSVGLGTISGLIVGFASFVFLYKFSSASRFNKKGMPRNLLTEELSDSIAIAANETDMESVVLAGKKESTGSMLVWNDKAYILHPVLIETAFTAIGRKARRLGYRGKNINPWLINLAFTEAPVWKSRGANMMTVLVDLENKNGNEPKVIGVSLPDTKRKLPIGVLPGRMLKAKNPEVLERAFEMLEDEFAEFVKPLNDKQKRALGRIGRIEDDSDTVDDTVEEIDTK